jgi:thioredoxin 1
MPAIYDVQLEDFAERVLAQSARRIVLVDFWADWCPPCLVVAPLLEQVVSGSDGKVSLAKLEVDAGDNMKLAGRYQVRGFPTVILFRDGEEKARFSGAQSVAFIEEFIAPWLD